MHPASNFGIIKTGTGVLGKIDRFPVFCDEPHKINESCLHFIIADSSGFVKQKFAKAEGIFLEPMEKMLRDMVHQLREGVKLWRIVSFTLAFAVIIAMFL